MAIVKGPALSLRASGNLGAICFSTWRGLAIARDTWTGTVPNTPKQLTQQGYLTGVAQAWGGTLTSVQRATWNERALTVEWMDRMGDLYIPSGYQLFLKWNIRRKVMNLVILLEAPVLQEWVYVGDLYGYSDLAGARIVIHLRKAPGTPIESYGVEYYKAGPYDSGGRRPIEGEWLFLDREVPPTYYLDSAVVLNKWYWYKGRQIAEYGDVGNWFEIQIQYLL